MWVKTGQFSQCGGVRFSHPDYYFNVPCVL